MNLFWILWISTLVLIRDFVIGEEESGIGDGVVGRLSSTKKRKEEKDEEEEELRGIKGLHHHHSNFLVGPHEEEGGGGSQCWRQLDGRKCSSLNGDDDDLNKNKTLLSSSSSSSSNRLNCYGSPFPYPQTFLGFFTPQFLRIYEIRSQLTKWEALKSVPRCWNLMRPLLCQIHFPKCREGKVSLISHHLCKAIKNSCRIIPFMNGGSWPEILRCNNTQIFGHGCGREEPLPWKFPPLNDSSYCLDPLLKTDFKDNYYDAVDDCGLKCHNPIYTQQEYSKIHSFVQIGAIIAFIASILAVATFLIDWNGKYPNIIIFNMNLCLVFVFLGFLIQFMVKDSSLTCRTDGTLRKNEPGTGQDFGCAAVFVLTYYFGTAALMWFVILTYSWSVMFTDMGTRKVPSNQEILAEKASFFIISSWSIPLVLTIAVIFMNSVEGQPLTGICFVKPDLYFLTLFIILPLLVVSLISFYFMTKSIKSLLKVQLNANDILSEKASSKIQTTVVKIGIYTSVVFISIIVSIVHTIIYFQNQESRDASLKDYILCRAKASVNIEQDINSCAIKDPPGIKFIQFQLLTIFLAAFSTSLWVATKNSVFSWKRFINEKIRKIDSDKNSKVRIRKHELITQAFAKRAELANQGRLSLTFQSSHVDPIGMKLGEDLESGSSRDFSSTWAAALPRLVQRRGALTGVNGLELTGAASGRRDSIDSTASKATLSIKSNRFSWLGGSESRRQSFDSQLSIPQTDLERLRSIYESTINKKSGLTSKRKAISRRLRNFGSRFSSRRGSFSSTGGGGGGGGGGDQSSNNSTILPAITLDPRNLISDHSSRRNVIPGSSLNQLGLTDKNVEYYELEEKLKILANSREMTSSVNDNINNKTATTIVGEDNERDDGDEKLNSVAIQTSFSDLSRLCQRGEMKDIGIQVTSVSTVIGLSTTSSSASQTEFKVPPIPPASSPIPAGPTTISSSSSSVGISGASSSTPLRHLEPNVIQIRVGGNFPSTSGESSIPSSYDRDYELLLKKSSSNNVNGNKENISADIVRPIHNRGRRGAIVETSFPTGTSNNLEKISFVGTSSTTS